MPDAATELPLQGQVALITGATGGIGSATCRLLASLGCSVGIHFNSDEQTAVTLQDELEQAYKHVAGAKFTTVRADMGNYDDVGYLPGLRLESPLFCGCILLSQVFM
jgi:3-oxoacyl-[acyl-carrier protein] reductase